MANKKISELPLIGTYGANAYVPIVDPDGSGATSRILATDLLAGPTVPWAPTSLTNLRVWLSDASGSFFQNSGLTTPATADGDAVAGWKRTTGSSVDVTNITLSAGTLRTNVVNGHSAVEIGTNTTLGVDSLTYFRGNWYALCVAKADALTTFNAPFAVGEGFGGSDSNYVYLSIWDSNVGGGTRFAVPGMGSFLQDTTVVGNAYAIYEVGFDGTNARLRVNGGSWQTGAAAVFTAAARFAVGAVYRPSGFAFQSPQRVALVYACDSWPDSTNLADSLAYAQAQMAL